LVAPSAIRFGSYSVHVGRGLLARTGELARGAVRAHRWALVTDEHVGPRYAARVSSSFGDARVEIFTVPAGEANKTRESWGRLTDELLAAGFGRDSALLALGGGMVGDLAGFAAATYLRGIPVVQLPTTLLAMIDASLGGKTGVNTSAGKNLVGAFHEPALVIADPDVLTTLEPRELRAGAAEAIKHGAIADAEYFAHVSEQLPAALADAGGPVMQPLIERSIQIKGDAVAADAREHGRRKSLNFGHTLGHAIETASAYSLLHGEAIAIGMVLEAQLAERLGIAERGTATRIRAAVERAELPAVLPRALDRDRIVALTHTDKKSRAGTVEYALPARIGAMAGTESGWAVAVQDDFVRLVLSER